MWLSLPHSECHFLHLREAKEGDSVGYLSSPDKPGEPPSTVNNSAYVYYTGRAIDELTDDVHVIRFARKKPGRSFLFAQDSQFNRLSPEAKAPWRRVAEQSVGHRKMLLLVSTETESNRDNS